MLRTYVCASVSGFVLLEGSELPQQFRLVEQLYLALQQQMP